MSFPKTINSDKIIKIILNDIGDATNEWLHGEPKSEEAFINRITRSLTRSRRNCDIGNEYPMIAESKTYILHRKGKNSTDRFGSDLAITVSIPSENFTKTALFQVKVSENYHTTIERKQIEDASIHTALKMRSFVLSVDDNRGGIRLNSIENIHNQYAYPQDTQKFDSTTWSPLSKWIWEWLSCSIGAGNTQKDPMPIEPLLRHLIVDNIESKLGEDIERFDLPMNFLPAKIWLRFRFNKK